MKKIRNIVILAVLVCGLIIVPNNGFAQQLTWADAFITPNAGTLYNSLGVFVGGDVPGSFDWSIGNRCPFPAGATTKDIVFSTNDGGWQERMRITKEGNVGIGIGTTSPISHLHIEGTQACQGYLKTSASTTLNNGSGLLTLVAAENRVANKGPYISFHVPYSTSGTSTIDSASIGAVAGDSIDGSWRGDIVFYTRNITGYLGEVMRIGGNGLVGIGTTSPDRKLHVMVTDTGLSPSYGESQFVLEQNDHSYLEMITPTDKESGIIFSDGSPSGRIIYGHNGDSMRFSTNGTEKIRILASGNVGIGTTSPVGKLDVHGSIYQRGSQLHADYVFEEEYELESIEEHAKYMWTEKHLKAIPKAEKDESGQEIVEVGAHRKGIVEELEKAHIYIEQLHKEIKAKDENTKMLIGKLMKRMEALESKN